MTDLFRAVFTALLIFIHPPEVDVAITFNQFMNAIAGQESGGQSNPYGVVNAYGAVGKYQVLKSNIPGWSKDALGYSITWQKFRDSPELQEKIVRHRLKKYWDQYGIKGAASAWYSGDPSLYNSTKPQPGGPSIKSYVDSVIQRAGGAPTTAPTATGGGGGGGEQLPQEKPMTKEERAIYYGYSYAFFSQDKELKQLLDRAVKGEWEKPKFQAEFYDTKWFRSRSSDERKFILMKISDPKTAQQRLQQAFTHVSQLAAQLGLKVNSSNKKRLDLWAYNVVAKGWNDEQLRYDIGKYLHFNNDVWLGEAGETQEKLRSYAYSMGVTMSSQWYANGAKAVVRGIGSIQDYQDQIRRQAKATYSGWSKQIDAGQTVADLAAPYFQSMSQILELAPGSINLFNPAIKKALQYKDPKTGKPSAKPIWQFESDLRNDPRWKKTQNAQDSLMSVAHQILSDFGFAY